MGHVYKTLGCYLSYLLGIKLTQKELAEKLGFTPQAINNWVNDKRRPDKETLLRLCVILRGIPEIAFKIAGYEIDPLEKSWYMEMQVEETPRREAHEHTKRQMGGAEWKPLLRLSKSCITASWNSGYG